MEEVKIVDLSGASSLEIAKKVVEILNYKDAKGIKLLHVEDQTILADYFLICSGSTVTQLRSYAGEVEYKMGLCNCPPARMEGWDEASWIVLDFHSVIVHIFKNDARTFYNLEKLWEAAAEVDLTGLVTEK